MLTRMKPTPASLMMRRRGASVATKTALAGTSIESNSSFIRKPICHIAKCTSYTCLLLLVTVALLCQSEALHGGQVPKLRLASAGRDIRHHPAGAGGYFSRSAPHSHHDQASHDGMNSDDDNVIEPRHDENLHNYNYKSHHDQHQIRRTATPRPPWWLRSMPVHMEFENGHSNNNNNQPIGGNKHNHEQANNRIEHQRVHQYRSGLVSNSDNSMVFDINNDPNDDIETNSSGDQVDNDDDNSELSNIVHIDHTRASSTTTANNKTITRSPELGKYASEIASIQDQDQNEEHPKHQSDNHKNSSSQDHEAAIMNKFSSTNKLRHRGDSKTSKSTLREFVVSPLQPYERKFMSIDYEDSMEGKDHSGDDHNYSDLNELEDYDYDDDDEDEDEDDDHDDVSGDDGQINIDNHNHKITGRLNSFETQTNDDLDSVGQKIISETKFNLANSPQAEDDATSSINCNLKSKFICLDQSECIELNRKCDGKPDCRDSSDELDCDDSSYRYPTTTTSSLLKTPVQEHRRHNSLARARARARSLNKHQRPEAPSTSPESIIHETSSSTTTWSTLIDNNAKAYRLHEGRPHYSNMKLHNKHLHFDRIRIGHEEHDHGQVENGFASFVVAIMFGVGVTATLVAIVSHKMSTIKQRIRIKQQRRSLVPDTEFLIKSLPT